jgi:hypothetical protein
VSSLAVCDEAGASVERALGCGRAALELAQSGAETAVLYAAALEGHARVLGAWQRREDAVRTTLPVCRRKTGGPACVGGEGIVYVAIAMQHASVFMECPRDRVLNRNVRGLLAALRELRASAHYFGREVVSVDRSPAGLLGWTRARDGAVLFEVFLGASRSFAIPEGELALVPSEPRMMGKAPITLREAIGAAPDARTIADACARAYAAMGGHDIVRRTLTPAPAVEAAEHPDVRWSPAFEAPIGFWRAGLATDARGVVLDAVLRGDFYQDEDAPERLRAALVGGHAPPERLRDAINAAYGKDGAVIEGLRSLQPVLDALITLAR